MGLYERIVGIERPKISPHTILSCLAERKRGKLTNQQVIDILTLSPTEQTELITLVTQVINNVLTSNEIEDVFILGEHGSAPYDTVGAIKTRFGV